MTIAVDLGRKATKQTKQTKTAVIYPVMFSDITLQLSYILLCFQTLRYSCHISCYVFRHYATVVIYPVMFSDITLQWSYILLCFHTLRYSGHISCYVFRHYATTVIFRLRPNQQIFRGRSRSGPILSWRLIMK